MAFGCRLHSILLCLVTLLAVLSSMTPARAQVVLSVFSLDQHVLSPASTLTIVASLNQPQTQGD